MLPKGLEKPYTEFYQAVVSGGRVRAQARDALKELLDSPPTGEPKGCCHD